MKFLQTTLLLATLTGILVVVGYAIGGPSVALVFLVFAAVMNFAAFWWSDKLALRMAGAREVSEAEEPQLHNMVREVANLAAMPMPRVYVIDNDSPNAFATGRSPNKAVVAVTTGIRRILTDRELRGVIGHEMGHVKNRDTLVSSIVATIAGAISFIAQMLMWRSLFGGRDSQHPLLMIAAMLIAPLAASLIQLGISRTREYGADATGAQITHDPEALASALEKLHRGVKAIPMEPTPVQESVSALYIVNPFNAGGMSRMFSTHPPMEERVKRLREMAVGRR